jgi:hypothetical protein
MHILAIPNPGISDLEQQQVADRIQKALHCL